MGDLTAIPLKRLDGSADALGHHAGNVLLVVNVASKCGLTPQYEGLEQLYKKYKDQGFEVLGFPANDFGAQEPGTNEEIAAFCSANFGVSFPMFSKADVTGDGKQPLYAALTAAKPEKEVPAR
jgi:glutathione peroxidase